MYLYTIHTTFITNIFEIIEQQLLETVLPQTYFIHVNTSFIIKEIELFDVSYNIISAVFGLAGVNDWITNLHIHPST